MFVPNEWEPINLMDRIGLGVFILKSKSFWSYLFSVSLSSLESDVEDIFLDNSSCNNLTSVSSSSKRKGSVSRTVRSNRHSSGDGGVSTGNISTHSLNEADLQVDIKLNSL